MSAIDILFCIALVGMFLALIYWLILSCGAYIYHKNLPAGKKIQRLKQTPLVSILVPAHNEALVIEKTVRSLAALDYPNFEIIVINDGSSDNTGKILESLCTEISKLIYIDIPKGKGGKGKSATLNRGLNQTNGELIAVYDADNTPKKDALTHLVNTLLGDSKLVAVNGKVRTRNRDASLLTRFINLEFINFQWLFQAGRWHWFKLSTLMGTNYLIYKDTLLQLGGFDESSLVDDLEMSLRIFEKGKRICWIPEAITWEQEPETLPVWFRQRVRWSRGNLYVVWKYFPVALKKPRTVGLEFMNIMLNYVIFLPTLFLSHSVFLLNILGIAKITAPEIFSLVWALSFFIYSYQVTFATYVEEPKFSNYLLGITSYFTYAQLFVPVSAKAIFNICRDALLQREMHWIKTPRTLEVVKSKSSSLTKPSSIPKSSGVPIRGQKTN